MNKIIRIAQVVGKMNSGGVESVIMNYYRNIDHTKVQFDFIVDSDSKLPQKDEIEKLGGRIIYISPYQRIFKYLKDLKKIFEKNDYKIVHSHLNTLNLFSLYVAKKCGIVVRISHNHSTAGKGEFKRNILKYMLRPLSKIYPTHYFACGEYAGRWLFGNKTFNNGKVKVINNAIDIDKFVYNESIRKDIRKELGLENRLVIGHVGRFMKQKNHDFLIDIFNEIQRKEKDAVLIFVGEGELEENIKNKVQLLNISDKVKFLGVRANVNEILQAMDAFLLPSLYEGFPVVGIEAQASGLLCFFSDNVTHLSKMLDTTTFISLETKASDWAEIIINKLKDYKRKDCYNEIRNNSFEIHNEAKKLEEMYLELLNKE